MRYLELESEYIFPALKSALLDRPKVPKDHADTLDDTLSDKIIALLKEDTSMKQELLAEKAKVSLQPLSE